MTSNPMTNERIYEGAIISDSPMTVSGAVNKTMGLLGIVVLVASYTWYLVATNMSDKVQMLMITGAIAAFVLALIAAFKPQHSKPLSIAYAASEGLFLGGVSAMFEAAFPGIVIQAVAGTFISAFVMLLLFKARIIRVTETFKAVVIGATLSIAILYLITLVMSLFGNYFLSGLIHSTSNISIIFSGIVIIIACLNLALDFDFIEKGASHGAPKYLEWYGALSLLVTLIWLYLEILRLLAKLNSRR